jgi:hypothetical protein
VCTPDRKRVFYARPGVGCSVILLRPPGLADNVVTLPLPEREWSEQDVDKIHAEAFRDLEVEVGDLERMGQIAQDYLVMRRERGWPPQSRSVHLRRDTSAGTAIRWTSREASALAR